MMPPRSSTEHSDIATWGIAALVCGAIAIVSANLSPLIPQNAIAALHATRLEGGNFNQLRAGMAEMRTENVRLAREARTVLTRLNLLDDDKGEMIRRLAAVERSLPLLIESLPVGTDIDRSLLTASIAATSPEVYEADGGIVIVRRSALFDGLEDTPLDQPMPPRIEGAYGIALGPEILREGAERDRSEIVARTGVVLAGLSFVLGEVNEAANARIIAGPLAGFEDAHILCEPIIVMGIACEPVPYEGAAWPG